jgi:hypothetical protein
VTKLVRSVPSALVSLGAILLLAGIILYGVDEASAALFGEQALQSSPLPDRGQAMWLMGGGIGFIGLGIFVYMRG